MNAAFPETPEAQETGTVPDWVFVAVGGALGAVGRGAVDAVAGVFVWSAGFGLLWSTVMVNVVGAGILGVLLAVFATSAPTQANARWKLFATTGFAGAFTTYGTLMTATVSGTCAEIDLGHVIPLSLLGSLALLAVGVLVAAGAKRVTTAVLLGVRGRGSLSGGADR